MNAPQDLKALQFAGTMGHTFAGVRGDKEPSVSGEYTSLDAARRLASDGERIYQRTAKSWQYVETKETVLTP
jgi:hypothetical protein